MTGCCDVTELLGGADRSAARRVWAGPARPDLGWVSPGCPPRQVQSCTEGGGQVRADELNGPCSEKYAEFIAG